MKYVILFFCFLVSSALFAGDFWSDFVGAIVDSASCSQQQRFFVRMMDGSFAPVATDVAAQYQENGGVVFVRTPDGAFVPAGSNMRQPRRQQLYVVVNGRYVPADDNLAAAVFQRGGGLCPRFLWPFCSSATLILTEPLRDAVLF